MLMPLLSAHAESLGFPTTIPLNPPCDRPSNVRHENQSLLMIQGGG